MHTKIRCEAQKVYCKVTYLMDDSWLCIAAVSHSVRTVNCAGSSASEEPDIMKE